MLVRVKVDEDLPVEVAELFREAGHDASTVAAQGSPKLIVDLEEAVTERLTPGIYTANILAIYDNGDSHSIRVVYTKITPSGEYTGDLTVYIGGSGSRSARVRVRYSERQHAHDLPARQAELRLPKTTYCETISSVVDGVLPVPDLCCAP